VVERGLLQVVEAAPEIRDALELTSNGLEWL